MATNILDFVTGASYPSREAVAYMDGASASRVLELQKNLSRASTDKEKAAITKEIKALQKSLEASKMVFHMKGFPPGVRDTLVKQAKSHSEDEGMSEDEAGEYMTRLLFAHTIAKVVLPDGTEDTHTWTPDEVRTLMEKSPNGSLNEVVSAFAHVSSEAINFARAVDVTF